MEDFLGQIKKTVIFLGVRKPDGKPQFHATGFVVDVQGVFHLVTAKHVVIQTVDGEDRFRDENLIAFYNQKTGGLGYTPISWIKKSFEVNWVLHQKADVDIAIIPFALNPTQNDLLAVPDKLFLMPDQLSEVSDVFFPSFQPGISVETKIAPVFRRGAIALVRDDGTLLIDGAVFPGNSGSPVFLKPSPIRFDKAGVTIGGDELGGKFIGIVGAYLPYQEIAVSTQTGRPRVIFEENTGLSIVSSVHLLNEIIASPPFKQQLAQQLAKKPTVVLPPPT